MLELLGIAELDQYRDCPFFIVVVWRKLQFARTSDAWMPNIRLRGNTKEERRLTVESFREPLSDRRDEVLQRRLPIILNRDGYY